MKKYLVLLALPILFFAQCKKSFPEPSPEINKMIGYWHNYDHFTYNNALDTTFSDTNQFVMMDLDILDLENLTKYKRDGSSPSQHTYDTTDTRMYIWSGTFRVTYKLELFGDDSITLSSLPRPAGGIPFPGSDKEIWVFVRK